MALRLEYRTNSGIIANYWKLAYFRWDAIRNELETIMGLYVREEERRAGAEPVALIPKSVSVNLDADDNPFIAIYDAVKTLPEFTNAEDC